MGNIVREDIAYTSFTMVDSFTSTTVISPEEGDSVLGTETIEVGMLENSFGECRVKLTGKKMGAEAVLMDTTWKIRMMSKTEEYNFRKTFFGYKEYKITSSLQDNFGNVDSAVSHFYPGKPKITIILSPDEVRPLYEAHNWEDSSEIEVLVVNSSTGEPVKGVSVNLEDKPIEYSGGHDHNGDRPSGTFEDINITTDSTGRASTEWTPPEFGGYEKIIARTTNTFFPAADTDTVTVRVDGLTFLPATPYYEKVGGTQYHHGPPGYAEDHNHYGTPDLVGAIYGMASNYRNNGGEIISINDMSLPFGGLFDIDGNWSPPHQTHRDGRNVDMGGSGINGRFLKHSLMVDTIIPAMERSLGVEINWIWEGNHYHLTVTGGE